MQPRSRAVKEPGSGQVRSEQSPHYCLSKLAVMHGYAACRVSASPRKSVPRAPPPRGGCSPDSHTRVRTGAHDLASFTTVVRVEGRPCGWVLLAGCSPLSAGRPSVRRVLHGPSHTFGPFGLPPAPEPCCSFSVWWVQGVGSRAPGVCVPKVLPKASRAVAAPPWAQVPRGGGWCGRQGVEGDGRGGLNL